MVIKGASHAHEKPPSPLLHRGVLHEFMYYAIQYNAIQFQSEKGLWSILDFGVVCLFIRDFKSRKTILRYRY